MSVQIINNKPQNEKGSWLLDLIRSRKMVWKLAKNDFKKRFAGSYLGIVWALVQPLVTVALYYVVFEMIFPSQRSSGSEVPFVLFLTAGLVPWFFFQEALNQGTAALMEYNYLVKKVVFQIRILPAIRVLAAVFVHAFFVLVLLVLSCLCGYYPSLHWIQVLYYSLCLFILVLGLTYATSAICVFFRDLSQIIAIVLQVGMWATPIMWDIGSFGEGTFVKIIRLNPLVYVIEGYRGAIYGKAWFFEMPMQTIYFWGITLILFLLGKSVFKRLQVHFADVL